ncbi:hypothetical protein JOM56_006565, partial [Amanita muscaria]
CDNCCLLLPLKAGAMAWATIITLYSIGGGIFLFLDGAYFFFTYPEWQIYGGISLVVGITAFLTLCAFSNKSYIWIRATRFLWSIMIIISAIRAIVIILELQRGKDNIIWECNNGGQLYSASVAAGYQTSTAFPSQFCASGFASLNTAWIIALLVDLAFQLYMCFLTWRYCKRLEHYSDLKTNDDRTYMLLMTPSSGF